MKLPSGQEVKNETLSEIADLIAVDMFATECSYNDAYAYLVVADSLENGYEGEHETLPSIDEENMKYLLELIRIPTLKYLEQLRMLKSVTFLGCFKNETWGEKTAEPVCPKCGAKLTSLTGYYTASIPAIAEIVDGELYVDTLDGIKLSDCIDDDVEHWGCPECDEVLFYSDQITEVTEFLKGDA